MVACGDANQANDNADNADQNQVTLLQQQQPPQPQLDNQHPVVACGELRPNASQDKKKNHRKLLPHCRPAQKRDKTGVSTEL